MPATHEAKYVGSETCRPCHSEVWSTFSKTGMGRSFYPLTADRSIEDWTKRNTFTSEGTGLHYRMERRDGSFFMRQFLLDASGKETAVDERRLEYVVGSAHHSRAYVVTWGTKLFQAPVCWYPRDGVWDLCPGYEQNNDYFSREISRTCVFCHNGRMDLLPDARNAYVEPYPHGIDCERCHGPGSLHVDRWARGEAPTGEGDPSIVNPKKLTPALRTQICFQCHLGDSKSTERVARRDKPLEAFRPGEPIASIITPLRFAQATPQEFGLSAQGDRMLLSRCYAESGGKLECVTCHDPHVTVYRQDRPADFFTSKCLGCHAVDACTAPKAARESTVPKDDCVKCHMRKTEPDDHRRVEFTDHWIQRRPDDPSPPRSDVTMTPYFPGDFAALRPGERAFALARGYELHAKSVEPAAQSRMWPLAESGFREAIAAGLDASDVRFFLGKSLSARGKHKEAAEEYARAYAAAPHEHDVAFAYGQALERAKQFDRAAEIFAAMTREHPESAAPWAEWARCAAEGGDYATAVDRYAKAIALEPWNPSLHQNSAMILAALGRFDEARARIDDALRYGPERNDIRASARAIAERSRPGGRP